MGLKNSSSKWPRIDPFFSISFAGCQINQNDANLHLQIFFKFLINIQLTESDPKNYRGLKALSLMPIRVNRGMLNCLIFSLMLQKSAISVLFSGCNAIKVEEIKKALRQLSIENFCDSTATSSAILHPFCPLFRLTVA